MTTKNKPEFSFADQLDSLIVFNEKAVIESEGSDYIRIKVILKLGKIARFVSKFFTVREHRIYLLTDYSFILIQQIRKRPMTVSELIRILAESEKLSFFEARALIVSFCALLMKRGIIAVEVPKISNPET